MEFQWHRIYRIGDDATTRAKVYGGWLVKHTKWGSESDNGNVPVAIAMTFVPDERHLWSVDND